MKNEKSDFGKGFVYNLILLAIHFERFNEYRESAENSKMDNAEEFYSNLWFNGASDHLYEFEIPKKFKNTLIGKKARKLQKIALDRGHGSKMFDYKNNEEDFIKVVKLAKEIGLLIDKELGVNPIKGRWK